MKRILIVDDSPMNLRSIKSMIDKEYEVLVALSGMQALQTLKGEAVDLILMDYEMPEMNGTETVEKIRLNEEIKDIPVVFLTGVNKTEQVSSALKLNPKGYLLKPVQRERLLSTIEEVLKEE